MTSVQKKITAELINIVPLRGTIKPLNKAAATPKLIHNGGPLISSVSVCPIFWGDAWNQPDRYTV